MKTLHFDMFSGVSGDMILGGLLALGYPVAELKKIPEALGIEGVTIDVSGADVQSVTANKVDIRYDEHGHHHRSLSYITKIINQSTLDPRVKELATTAFTRLGEAEAEVHGKDIETIHFHEVGAVDSIVDIVGACDGVVKLGVEKFTASPFTTGTGFVDIAHGRIPVPVPATSLLIRGFPVHGTDVQSEMTTPTGAALVTTFVKPENFGTLSMQNVVRVGYGAGSRKLPDRPNILRLVLGESESDAEQLPSDENVGVVEANIDDMNPQFFEHVSEVLFSLGALDVFSQNVQMKKNRSGVLLTALCRETDIQTICDAVLRETTTIGVRFYKAGRKVLERTIEEVKTPWGKVRFKAVTLSDGTRRSKPEYEDLKRLAAENKLPITEIEQKVISFLDAG